MKPTRLTLCLVAMLLIFLASLISAQKGLNVRPYIMGVHVVYWQYISDSFSMPIAFRTDVIFRYGILLQAGILVGLDFH